MTTPALVIAAHGTRDPQGEQICRELCRRTAALIPEAVVSVGFIELSSPSVPEALDEVISAGAQSVVVAPLMLGTGSHVQHDIPDFIDEIRARYPDTEIAYAAHLGHDPMLFEAVRERLEDALAPESEPAWQEEETTLIMVGRGALVPEANADHVRLARLHYELGNWQEVAPAFIQVTQPCLPEGLSWAYNHGRRQFLVLGHWLFPGRLRTWTSEQAAQWGQAHPDAAVRVAEVIGDCDALAAVVTERYRAAASTLGTAQAIDSPTT